MTEEKASFQEWMIVELFGHTRIAGLVSEATIGGCSFIRVDIPAGDKSWAITKFYGNGAIYSMTPVSEEVVRLYIKHNTPAPINVYMPEIRTLPEKVRPQDPVEDWDPYDDDDEEENL